jgi:indolepyruvate ferredoxin oxidoreductase
LEKLGMTAALGTQFRERLAFLDFKDKALARPRVSAVRQPYFCSGCPHNTSTRVPEGSRASAGIGCHFMALSMDRNTATFTHMGAEGAPWIGQAPFTDEKHIFVNLGDGTYFHSGLLAIRAAVAAKVNVTYKILYNDAVAMTGGQRVDGPLDPAMISRQIAAEGVKPVVVVTDEPDKYPAGTSWAPGVTVRHRDELDAVQRELRELPGVSALIYDQTCASEKRRRRKRNEYPDPARRVVINDAVCEGCGDCSVKSNCLSVEPLETELGLKRTINQSSCNKDFSCLKGFCPSFVTVEGGRLRKGRGGNASGDVDAPLPPPALPALTSPFGILVTGIGGTGVITIGQIIGMAAHIEGKGAMVLDMSGLAQKYGAVMSHVQIGATPEDLHCTRLDTGGARLVIGCDLIVSAGNEALARMAPGITRAVVNANVTPTAEFMKDPDRRLPGSDLQRDITDACGEGNVDFVPATSVATALMGDAIASNMFMLGYAYQKGWVPLAAASLERAIELNGVAVDFNQQSFRWGRHAALDLARVQRLATPAQVMDFDHGISRSLDDLVARRVELLTVYQDPAYAARYKALVEKVRTVEQRAVGSSSLARAVARTYAKLLSYKDEYEVARLHADPAFRRKIAEQFEGDYKVAYHLAPPLLASRDPLTGEPRKMRFGPWMLPVFKVLQRLKFLRGTALDPFGRTADRRMERALIRDYEDMVDVLLAGLSPKNHVLAVEIAQYADEIRGFGHVKDKNAAVARKKRDALLASFRQPDDAHTQVPEAATARTGTF